jgi:hypothetical protein
VSTARFLIDTSGLFRILQKEHRAAWSDFLAAGHHDHRRTRRPHRRAARGRPRPQTGRLPQPRPPPDLRPSNADGARRDRPRRAPLGFDCVSEDRHGPNSNADDVAEGREHATVRVSLRVDAHDGLSKLPVAVLLPAHRFSVSTRPRAPPGGDAIVRSRTVVIRSGYRDHSSVRSEVAVSPTFEERLAALVQRTISSKHSRSLRVSTPRR